MMKAVWTDRQVEVIIGNILRSGVLLAAFVVLLGGAVYLTRHGRVIADYRSFHGEPNEFRSVTGIVHSALDRSGRGIIQLGLLLLIATPVIRVAFSIVAFAVERDRLYVFLTCIVLLVLLYSLLGYQRPLG